MNKKGELKNWSWTDPCLFKSLGSLKPLKIKKRSNRSLCFQLTSVFTEVLSDGCMVIKGQAALNLSQVAGDGTIQVLRVLAVTVAQVWYHLLQHFFLFSMEDDILQDPEAFKGNTLVLSLFGVLIMKIIIIMKNFNRRISHGHRGSTRHKLAQHARSRGSLTHLHQHSYNHVMKSTSTAITEVGIKFLFWRYLREFWWWLSFWSEITSTFFWVVTNCSRGRCYWLTELAPAIRMMMAV